MTILVKHRIKQLVNQEKELKEKLKPLIQDVGSVDLEDGRVYLVNSSGSKSFKRLEVLEYIRESYGDALAEQIDQDCTTLGEPRQSVYVSLNDFDGS